MTKKDETLDEIRGQILEAAHSRLCADGWCDWVLEDVATDLGLASGTAQLVFPDGAADLLAFASQEEDKKLLDVMRAADLSSMPVRQRVTFAIRRRLEALEDHRAAVRHAVAFLARPQNAGLGAKLLCSTADTIWFGLGDASTDYNYYTKRAILSGVYSSTLLCWLGDLSQDRVDTWAFLDRRIENVMQFEKAKGEFNKFIDKFPLPFMTSSP